MYVSDVELAGPVRYSENDKYGCKAFPRNAF